MRRVIVLIGITVFLIAPRGLAPNARADGPPSGPPGVIETFAGGGTTGGDAPALESNVVPYRLLTRPNGDIVVSSFDGTLRSIANGIVHTIVGRAPAECAQDNITAGGEGPCASLARPVGIAQDALGNLYVADSFHCLIRRVDALTYAMSTFAGKNDGCSGPFVDGIPKYESTLGFPDAVAIDASGSLYIGERDGCQIRRVSSGTITTVVGIHQTSGFACVDDGAGGNPLSTRISTPEDIVFDRAGAMYFVSGCRVVRLSAGLLETVAGNGSCLYSGQGAATSVSIGQPEALAFDADGRLFVTDSKNCLVWVVFDGFASVVAGNTQIGPGCGSATTGVQATSTFISQAAGVTTDTAGNLYFSDLSTTLNFAKIRIVYGAAIDSDGDGYTDAREASIGRDPHAYCATMRADIDGDGVITPNDLALVAQRLGSSEPFARRNQNRNRKINSTDLRIVARHMTQRVADCP